jgi:serine/threonine protein kinase
VVRVYGTGVTTNESPFLVLEFVPGGTLRDLLEERPGEALPTHHAVQIIGEIGEGLAAAHRVGVVHRDVKPENVLIGQNSAKLVDFGMAKVLGKEAPEITFGSKICGTPQYMPPERAQGRPVTSAADVYSLGVIAYELLTGQLPFNFKSPVEVMTAHITKDPPPMPEVNEELEQVIRSAMLKIPQMRPSAMGFVGALRRTARTAHQG